MGGAGLSLAITAPDEAPMPTSSIPVSMRQPRAVLMVVAFLFGVAGCQQQSRAAAGEGPIASGDDTAAQSQPQPHSQSQPPAPVAKPAQVPTPKPASPSAPLPDVASGTVVLGSGDEATVAPGTQLRFLRMVNDSRCPKDAQCVWAGEVTIEFELKSPSGTSRFQLSSARAPSTPVGALQFELQDYGPCPPASKHLTDAECATVATTSAATR